MIGKNFSKRLYDAVANYYIYNPDTLMPLMMVALATQGKLHITEGNAKPSVCVCSLQPSEIRNYDWVQLDENLKDKVDKWIDSGVACVSVELEIGRSLMDIYKIFKRNDEKDVVQEYHHRIGRLVHHSSNEPNEKAHRQYATFILAETLLAAPKGFLKKEYFLLFSRILAKSGLQPKRPRIGIARTLNTLLQYDGKGLVYNPFAGCSIAGAMLKSKDNYYGDGDTNDKLYAAGLLLNYGMGVSNEHFLQRDSKEWLTGKRLDYVLSTYTGYVDGQTAFDFCLGKCLNDDSFCGKYAGMVLANEIFDKQTPYFKEALERDWVETIVLLHFGEAAVLINANKSEEYKNIIRFIDEDNPLARFVSIEEQIAEDKYAEFIDLRDAKKEGGLKSVVVSELPEREGYKKVRLGDILKRMPRKVYDINDFTPDERVLASINRNETYYGRSGWNENIERRPIANLFGPAYLLDEDCLVVNKKGLAEPRLFDSDYGHAFFDDGYAFSLNGCNDPFGIINELQETYVRRQLHPYGVNEMVPQAVSEEDYLNLILYKSIDDDEENFDLTDIDLSNNEEETPENRYDGLETGYVLTDGNKKYTILNFIANGSFGYTYRAEMLSRNTGEKEIVAIKEFYPKGVMQCKRDNNRVVIPEFADYEFNEYKEMFRSEPDFILKMNDVPDNHVTEVKSIFEYEPTGTMYYVMKFYAGESLEDMIRNNQVPTSEELAMEKIIIPICKALNVMHTHKILHLDIKPENIVIDDNGEAVLIDFGVALLYDENDNIISSRGIHSTSPFSAPENSEGQMKHFGPQADIYGAAGTLFQMYANNIPHSIENESVKRYAFDVLNCSDQMKEAITEGMWHFANDRPSNAQSWLNMFPGGKDIKL